MEEPLHHSIHELLLNAATKIHSPEDVFLWHKKQGVFESISYKETLKNIGFIANYLHSIGLKKGDRVAIIHENSPEYIFFDQALMKLGLVNVSIYPTLTAQETEYILNDSQSKFLLLSTPFQFAKFQKIKNNCNDLLGICTSFSKQEDGVVDFKTLLEKGQNLDFDKEIQAIFSSICKEDLATLIYTSGTTGEPKGVMLSHGNFIYNAEDALQLCPTINKSDKFLSFLPLSHVYERMVSYILAMRIGAQIAFAESIDKVSLNFEEVRPSIVACVPRVLEKVEDKIRRNANNSGKVKAAIFNWAIGIGKKNRIAKDNKKKPDILTQIFLPVAEKLVFSKIKTKLGGNIKLIVSGGGALPVYVGEFFGNIGIRVQEGYGLSETSPFVSVNEFDRQIFGTVGRIGPRQQVAIQNLENYELITVQNYHSFDPEFYCEEGEILVKGPNVMQGYWRKEEETQKVFDSESWFHTGDVGQFTQGYLKITDRIKNMLKTSLGKNIYPTPIENIYLQSPKIEQIFIIGDKREYITAILYPNMDEINSHFGENRYTQSESNLIIIDPEIKDWIMEDVKVLSHKLAKFERIRDFILKSEAFSVENEELTITQKQKRKFIEQKYALYIEEMYK
jgi:long-chain acyl-CoA synthetase